MATFPKGVFVTGTDTGVGKTVVTTAIVSSLLQSGKAAVPMKPLQTGTNLPGAMDIEFALGANGLDYSLDSVCPYRLTEPLSPLVAAEIDRVEIDIHRIADVYQQLSSDHDTVVVEGAGGLLVPITESYFMSDLARELSLPVVIVIRPGLGTLNHTLLTLETAKSRGLEVLGLVINGYPTEPNLAEKTNPVVLTKLSGSPILGVLPHDPGLSVEDLQWGNLKGIATGSIAPLLGGTFSSESFLNRF